jgi:hypothetical protein
MAAGKNRKTDDDDLIVPKDAASVSFVKGMLGRGQAARANSDGSLPPGATHEVVGETEASLPILRRRRVYWSQDFDACVKRVAPTSRSARRHLQ